MSSVSAGKMDKSNNLTILKETMNSPQVEIYQADNGTTEISVQIENETVWLNLNQLTELFQRDKSVISRHISNIFKEKELEENSVVARNATTAMDGKIYQVG